MTTRIDPPLTPLAVGDRVIFSSGGWRPLGATVTKVYDDDDSETVVVKFDSEIDTCFALKSSLTKVRTEGSGNT